jgi:carbamoyltransferase
MTKIIGINCYHPGSSACLIENGKIINFFEEERINRIKNWSGFPEQSIKLILKNNNLDANDIDYYSFNSNPYNFFWKKVFFSFKNFNFSNFLNKTKKFKKKIFTPKFINSKKIIRVDHHLSHICSSLFLSKFNECALLSLDGFGDFCSASIGYFKNNKIEIHERIFFPNSLGVLYHAVTQYLGFNNYGDEYKVMGLSASGNPVYKNYFEKIIKSNKNKYFTDTSFFNFHKNIVDLTKEDGFPRFNKLYSKKFEKLFNEIKYLEKNDEVFKANLASSVQYFFTNKVIDLINYISRKYKSKNLCYSGGCAMNSLTNGQIVSKTDFKNVFISHSPGDSGGAIGSALYVEYKENGISNIKKNINNNSSPFLGLDYTNKQIKNFINENKKLKKINFKLRLLNEKNIYDIVTDKLINKKIIGWFQGRMECGARALGNRSLIADPRNKNIKNLINKKIKLRENFRPFAPAILKEFSKKWFYNAQNCEYMSFVFKFKESKIKYVPGVVHVDGTGRLQTVDKKINKKFYYLIKNFYNKTKIPILLNTSLNENEPIIMNPNEALDFFIRTNVDIVVIGNYLLEKK